MSTATKPRRKARIKLPVISVAYLQAAGACEGGIEQFIDVFGEGARVKVTRESLKRFVRHAFEVEWLVSVVVGDEALRRAIFAQLDAAVVKLTASEDAWQRKSEATRGRMARRISDLREQLDAALWECRHGGHSEDVLRELSAALAEMTVATTKLLADQERLHAIRRKGLAKVDARVDAIADLLGLK